MTDPAKFLRRTCTLVAVLRVFLVNPTEEVYSLEIMDAAHLGPSTVHANLRRLAEIGWISGRDEGYSPKDFGRTPRRYYRLTALGRANASAFVDDGDVPVIVGRDLPLTLAVLPGGIIVRNGLDAGESAAFRITVGQALAWLDALAAEQLQRSGQSADIPLGGGTSFLRIAIGGQPRNGWIAWFRNGADPRHRFWLAADEFNTFAASAAPLLAELKSHLAVRS